MHLRLCIPTLALFAAALPAQLSGTFSIDPNGPAGTFHSFTEAVNALFVAGVNGPVDLVVAPGTYTESVLVPPIQGCSPTNRVTFRAALGPGTVLLGGSLGDTFALLGVAFLHNSSIGWHGIDFTGGPGHAISGTQFVEDLEIAYCVFHAGHRSNAVGEYRHAIITSENSGQELGWRVHHSTLTLSSHTNRTSYGIYLSNGGGWEIHDNVMDMNGGEQGIYLINNNRRVDSIYNNLFVGSLYAASGTYANNVCVIREDVSNFENTIANNTFAITVPTSGCCIATAGYGTGAQVTQNYVFGNVFTIQGPGVAICLTSYSTGLPPFQSNGNVFFCPNGEIGRDVANIPGPTTLAAWQLLTNQDTNSVEADPLLQNPFTAPYDLRPLPNSPVTSVAVNTPSYVTTDINGRLRDSQPDAGAYELSGFALYGQGCAGTNALVPAMSSTGTVALGSPNFAFQLAQGAPSTLAVLMGGLSRTLSNQGPLPFALGGGCAILAAPEALVSSVTSAQGAATVPFPIPNSPSLAGFDLFFQWAVVDAASGSAYGITVSEGGALQL